jgi:DNA-binding NarL/FixJ family response regulator
MVSDFLIENHPWNLLKEDVDIELGLISPHIENSEKYKEKFYKLPEDYKKVAILYWSGNTMASISRDFKKSLLYVQSRIVKILKFLELKNTTELVRLGIDVGLNVENLK